MDIKVLIEAAYLLAWLMLFLFVRPKKRKWRIWLCLVLLMFTPCLYLQERVVAGVDEWFPDPSGLGERSTIVNYMFGPFFGIKAIDVLFPPRPWGTPTFKVYHYLIPFNSDFQYTEVYIPCLFFIFFLLAIIYIMIMAKKYINTGKPSLLRTGRASLYAPLTVVLLMSLFAYLFMDKLRWPYFIVELLVMCVLSYLISRLRAFSRRNSLVALFLVVLAFPLPSPSEGCLCNSAVMTSSHMEPDSYQKEEFRIHFPSIEPVPVALYQLSKVAFSVQCPCSRNPNISKRSYDVAGVLSETELSVAIMTIFSLLLFGAVLIKSGVVPPLLSSEDTGEGNMTTEKMNP